MSDEPSWLTRAEVERIHMKVIDAAGGSHGLRDTNLLESALAKPRNLHAYGESDTFQLAASYAEGIARNHAFVDGNKRTAWTTAEVFLMKHGKYIEARTDDSHVQMMENFAQGNMTREAAADYLRKHSRAITQEQPQQANIRKPLSPEERRQRSRDKPKRTR